MALFSKLKTQQPFKTFFMKASLTIAHITAAIIVTVVLLVLYTSVQQSYRSAANDPQIQIARDVCDALGKGRSINRLFSADTIDLSQSLAVFTEIFDKNGKPLQSTGFINGSLPKLPAGVFDFTNANNEDILTWQPQSNIRMAMVVEKVRSPVYGFVAAGRSLKETEARESNLLKMVGLAWLICMAALCVHLLVQIFVLKRSAK